MQNSKSSYFAAVLKRLLILAAIIAVILLMWCFNTGCLIEKITGIPCPSCGMTRALFALLRGDFAESFQMHPMLLSVPVLALMFLFYDKLFTEKSKLWSIFLLSLILIGFAVNYIIKLTSIFLI